MELFVKVLRFSVRFPNGGKPDATTVDKLFSAGVDPSWFYEYAVKEVRTTYKTPMACLWAFIDESRRANAVLPSESEVRKYLVEDETISEGVRAKALDLLRSAKRLGPVDPDDLPSMLRQLQAAKCRHIYISTFCENEDKVDTDPVALLEHCLSEFGTTLEKIRRTEGHRGPQTLREMFTQRDFLAKKDMAANAIEIHYGSWQATLGGLKRGELVVLSGLPKVGKSFIAHDMAMVMAMKGYKVVIAELELTDEQVIHRYAARLTGLPTRKIESGQLNKAERKLLRAYIKTLSEADWMDNLLILDLASCNTPARIEAAVNTKFDGKMDVLVVDFLAMMHPSYPVKGAAHHEELRQVIRELKELLKKYNVAGLTMCHTTRAGDTQFKIVDELCDSIIRLYASKDRPYVPPNIAAGQWVGEAGLIEAVVQASRTGAGMVKMGVMIEYATADVRDSAIGYAITMPDAARGNEIDGLADLLTKTKKKKKKDK